MDNHSENQPIQTAHSEKSSGPKFISQRTLILILALAGITLFFLFLAIRPQFKKQELVLSPTPTPTPAAQSVLSLQQAQQQTPGTMTYNVVINSNINTVNAVQLELAFDPKVLSNITVTPGPFFPKPVQLIKNIDYKNGRISYALGIQPADYGVKGQGVVATVTFSYVPTAQSTTITFLPKTIVAAEGVTQSVLRDALPATVQLNQINPSK